jgi:N-terminal region of Chorein or VPS13
MVLEGVVVEVVNRFLGEYVQNLNKSQLSLSLWGGQYAVRWWFTDDVYFLCPYRGLSYSRWYKRILQLWLELKNYINININVD